MVLLADRQVVSTLPPTVALVDPMADMQLAVPAPRAVALLAVLITIIPPEVPREVMLQPTAVAALVRSAPAALAQPCNMAATKPTHHRTRPTQLQRTAFTARELSRTRIQQISWLLPAISSQMKSI